MIGLGNHPDHGSGQVQPRYKGADQIHPRSEGAEAGGTGLAEFVDPAGKLLQFRESIRQRIGENRQAALQSAAAGRPCIRLCAAGLLRLNRPQRRGRNLVLLCEEGTHRVVCAVKLYFQLLELVALQLQLNGRPLCLQRCIGPCGGRAGELLQLDHGPALLFELFSDLHELFPVLFSALHHGLVEFFCRFVCVAVHVVPKVGKIGDTRFQQAGVQAEPGTVFSQCSIRQIVTS